MGIHSLLAPRQAQFQVPDYMKDQKDLTAHMRTILVDWLVEVQENFELNHETLYLAIKLVDLYLTTHQVPRDRLQLIGATALFMSCKFDVSITAEFVSYSRKHHSLFNENSFLWLKKCNSLLGT